MPIQDSVNAKAAGQTYLYGLTFDPSISGASAFAGTVALGVGTNPLVKGKMWQKQSTGFGTDWTIVSTGALKVRGTWDANANLPNLITITKTQGDFWIVTVAGTTNLGGINDWAVNDWAVYLGAGTWAKIDNSDLVISVNSVSPISGNVVLPASAIPNDSLLPGLNVAAAFNNLNVASLTVYVDINRTDIYTETGTILFPYKTLSAAMAAITDAADLKRYIIKLAPGVYSGKLIAKPFVYLDGSVADAVKLTNNTDDTVLAPNTMGFLAAFLKNLTIENLSPNPAHSAVRVQNSGSLFLQNCSVLGINGKGGEVENNGILFGQNTSYVSGSNDGVVCHNGGFLALDGGIQSGMDLTTWDISVEVGGWASLSGNVQLYNNRLNALGTMVYSSPASIILNDSAVTGITVKDALNDLNAAKHTHVVTRTVYVDKNRIDIYVANGSIQYPYKTAQAAINYIATVGVAGQDWCIELATGQYQENLVFENAGLHMITLEGNGVVGIAPIAGNSIQSIATNANLVKFHCRNIEFTRPLVITGATGGNTFNDVWFSDCKLIGAATLTGNCLKNISFSAGYIETDISLTNVAWFFSSGGQMQGAFTMICNSTLPASSGGSNCTSLLQGVYGTGAVTLTKGGVATGVLVLVGSRMNSSSGTIINPVGWTVQLYGAHLRGNFTNNGTLQLRTGFIEKTLINAGTLLLDQPASQIKNDSTVTGVTVKDALNNLVASITTVASTDKFYVDGTLGNDLTANGTQGKPFKTIQACLNFIGQPITKADYMRTIEIYISDALTSGVGSSPQTWNGVYEENLTVPCRSITFFGDGVKIGNNAGSGFGNILKEYSKGRTFGCSSSDFRPCATFNGSMNVRDSHNRLRRGMHVGGTCRTTILSRTFNNIFGDGVNKITVQLTPGQFYYPITIPTTYPSEPLIRILVSGTTNYSGLYDITSQVGPTTFQATRVSGVNPIIAPEFTGSFFESDSAGASGMTHDAAFVDTYMQGAYTADDGIVNGAAPTSGIEVLYAVNSRFFTGIEGRGILLQRWEDTTLAGTSIVNSLADMFNCSLVGALTISSFTYSADDMGMMSCRFNSAMVITVGTAGQIARIDALTYASFLANGCSWGTNTPFIDIFDAKCGTSLAIPFTVASTSPFELVKLITGVKIKRCRIFLSTIFNDATATLTVGDSGNISRYLAANENVPNELGMYEANNLFQLTANTAINIYINKAAATTGAGLVILDIG